MSELEISTPADPGHQSRVEQFFTDGTPAELPEKPAEEPPITNRERGVHSPLVLKGTKLVAHDGVVYVVDRINRQPVPVRKGAEIVLRHAHSMTLRRAVPKVRRDRQARKEQKRLRLRQRLAEAAAGQLRPGEKFVDIDWQVDPPSVLGEAVSSR